MKLAFPFAEFMPQHGAPVEHRNHLGLTKLEWFAGMVASGLEREAIYIAGKKLNMEYSNAFAVICFDLAQAMLDEAEKRSGSQTDTNDT